MRGRRSQTSRPEFETVHGRVEWYFDSFVDDVAVTTPVTREGLLQSLVTLQVAGSRRRSLLLDAGDVAHQTAGATAVWIPEPLVDTLSDAAYLTPWRVLAAREVMQRLASAMTGGDHDPQPNTVPFVLVPGGDDGPNRT